MNRLAVSGLSSETLTKIQQVFAGYPDIDRVSLYGSRAKGNYRTGSDIDLSLFGDALTDTQLLSIENELDDLLLPYKIDLSLFRKIENAKLVEHIQQVGVDFYCRQMTPVSDCHT